MRDTIGISAVLWILSAPALVGCWPFKYDAECGARCDESTTVVDLFVDPVLGDDNQSGSEHAPFKTLERALSVVKQGQTVRLLGGSYGSANGDDFTTPVPNGVSLVGDPSGNTVFIGTRKQTALRFAGSGEATNVRIEGFGTAVTARDGDISLAQLDLSGNDLALSLSENVQATLSQSTLHDGEWGIILLGNATLVIDGGSIRHVGSTCAAKLAHLSNSSVLTFNQVFVDDCTGSIQQQADSVVNITQSSLQNLGMGCETMFSVNDMASLHINDTTVVQLPTDGLSAQMILGSPYSTIALENGSITAAYTAIDGGQVVDVDHTAILGLKDTGYCGICTEGEVRLNGALITQFQLGIGVEGTATIRSSQIEGNDVGVGVLSDGALDMGTATEAGNNVVQNNSFYGLAILAVAPKTHKAVGNMWIPNNQGSNANGEYMNGMTAIGPFGTNDPIPANIRILSTGPIVKLAF